MANATIGDLQITPLAESLQFMKEFGFFEVVLPMILVFAIFYGVLIFTSVFGEPDEKTKPLYSIIAFVASFFVIASTDVVRMINEIIPTASFLLILVVLVLMILGMLGVRPAKTDYFKDAGWGAKIMIGILLIIFLGVVDMSLESVEIPIVHDAADLFVDDGDSGSSSGSGSSGDSGGGIDPETASMIINFLIVIALMVGLPIVTIYLIVTAGNKKS
jgi:hypothetical protein